MAEDRHVLSYVSARPRFDRRDSRPAQFSLAMGILSVPANLACLSGAAFGLLAIVAGIRAIAQINRSNRYGGLSFAITGITLGTLSVIVAFVYAVGKLGG